MRPHSLYVYMRVVLDIRLFRSITMFSATDNNMHNVANIPHNIVSTTISRHVNVNNVMDHPRSIPSSAYGKAHEVVDRLASLCQVEKDITQS